MRFSKFLAVSAATVALAACGGSGNADADGDGRVSAEEMKNAAADMEPLQPGEYKMSMELVELEDPTVTPEELEQAKSFFGMMSSMAPAKCMTAEELENPMVDLADNMQDGDCEVTSMNASGGNMKAEMSCSGDKGAADVTLESTSTATSSQMTMTAVETTEQGPKRMVMKIGMERQGDCPN